MNRKQQLATGILALVIVGSVAFMPVSAERKEPPVSMARHSGTIGLAPVSARELPQDQIRDLTYN